MGRTELQRPGTSTWKQGQQRQTLSFPALLEAGEGWGVAVETRPPVKSPLRFRGAPGPLWPRACGPQIRVICAFLFSGWRLTSWSNNSLSLSRSRATRQVLCGPLRAGTPGPDACPASCVTGAQPAFPREFPHYPELVCKQQRKTQGLCLLKGTHYSPQKF